MKHFSFFLIFLFSSLHLLAQNFSAGALTGGNFNKTYVVPSTSFQPYDGAPGLVFGIYSDYRRSSLASMRGELTILSLGTKTPVNTFHQNYLALSILPRLRIGKILHLEAGILAGLALNKSLPDRNSTHSIGLAGISFSFERMEAGVRYQQSISPYYKEGNPTRKFFYRGVQLTIGYRIL
jgi:hypothetical protein